MTSWVEEQRAAALERDYIRHQERRVALTVDCPEPGCASAVGVECRNLRTGRPLEHQSAHDKRVKAGQAAAEETQG